MENDKGSERRISGRKRKPFFDRTNLIHAASPTLRKLSSTLSETPQFLTPIRDIPAEPSVKLTSEPSKPSTSKADSNSSTSNVSIRASNFRTPSLTHPSNPTGKESGATNEKLIVYSSRSAVTKTKNKAVGDRLGDSHEDTDLFGFSPVSRTWDLLTDIKGKGKVKSAPDNCPTTQKLKDKENVTVLDLGISKSLLRDKENVTALNLEKSTSLRRDKENVAALNLEKSKGLKRVNYLPHSRADLTEEDVILLENVNTTKRKAISTAYSSSANKARSSNFRGNFNKEGTSHVKSRSECKKKRPCSTLECDLQKDLEKQKSYFKEVDEFELAVEEVSD